MLNQFKSALKLLSLVFLVQCLSHSVLHGQESLGRIAGFVHDPSGNSVPKASVKALRLATNTTTEVETSTEGNYVFNSLQIGEYKITVTAQGFQTAEKSNVRAIAGITVTANFDLVIGAVTTTVEVTSEATPIDVSSNSVGTTRTNLEISTLPNQLTGSTRDAKDFLRTLSYLAFNEQSSNLGGGGINNAHIAGAQAGSESYDIDGVPAGFAANAQVIDYFAPTPEMVDEFRVSTNSSAEQRGNSGVAITLVTKSGTNNLHGSVFEYLRNTSLDAKNWFAAKRSVEHQNEWGFVLGGPVVIPKLYDGRNKTFFFMTYGGFRYVTTPSAVVRSVPTAAMRAGDFSGILGPQIGTDSLGNPVFQNQIFDPATTRPDGKGGFIRDPFPGNLIPANRISSISKYFQPYIPLPNQPGITNNFLGNGSPTTVSLTYKWSMKIDQNFGSNHRLSGSWQRANFDQHFGGDPFAPEVSSDWQLLLPSRQFRINYTWTMRTNLIFNLRGGFNRLGEFLWAQGYPIGGVGAKAGIKGVFSADTPNVGITNLSGFGPTFTTQGLILPQQVVPWNADFSWVKGSHNIKLGGDYFIGITSSNINQGTNGSFNYNNKETGQTNVGNSGVGYASYLLGEVDSSSLSNTTSGRFTTNSFGLFIQDSWKVKPRWVLNYGLRWDVYLPMKERWNRISYFDPTVPNPGANNNLGALSFWGGPPPQRNGRTGIWDTNWGALAPNFGFAFSLNPKTVIRASAGISNVSFFSVLTSGGGVSQYGSSASITAASLNNGVTPAFNWNGGFPPIFPATPSFNPALQNGSPVNAMAPGDMGRAYTENFNFGIEREIPWNIVFRANYFGKNGRRLPTNQYTQLNQLDPRYLSYGNLLLANINSPEAVAAGIPLPYPGFNGPVNQALRPYPQYQNVNLQLTPEGFSLYNAGVFEAQKRFSAGLTFLVSYTISKNITNIGSFNDQGYQQGTPIMQNTALKKYTRYVFDLDQPQNLVVSYVYELPFGPGKKHASSATGVKKHLVGGWSVAGVQQYRSGRPILLSTNNTLPGGFFSIWANRENSQPVSIGSGCGDYDPHSSSNRVLNPLAFSSPAPFTLGNTAMLPNARSCGYTNENISVLKTFSIHENVRFLFGADFINAFNRHNWTGLTTNINNPSFGVYNSATNPRFVQIRLKIEF